MRVLIILISLAAIGLAATIAALGPGTRFGLWDFGFALGLMRQIALPTLIAAGLAVVAFLLAVWRAQGLVVLAFVAALGAGAAAYAPIKMRALATSNPFIHDITTDFDDPPAIVAAADAPRKNPAAYAGGDKVRNSEKTVAEAQREAFPDIVPLYVTSDVDRAAQAARDVIAEMKMEVLADNGYSTLAGNGRVIEAVATSRWYGFKDDFVVRIAPQEGGGVRVDVRSQSRVGLSDLGQNAARTRAFLANMKARLPVAATA